MRRIRFSLRTFLAIVALFATSMFLTRIDFVVASIILTVGLALLRAVLPRADQRFVIYGAVVGIAIGIALMLAYIYWATGLTRARTYEESSRLGAISDAWRPYVMQLGAFFGGFAGLSLSRLRDRQPANASVSTDVASRPGNSLQP
jgi:hypothetical protein